MSFENKVVIITGAGSGLGAATAIAFAKEGANVIAVDIKEERVKDIAEKIESFGRSKPLTIKADVTKDEEAKTIIKETVEKFGKLDVLVNNAGVSRAGSILDRRILDAYDEMVAVNLKAIIHLTTLAAPYLITSNGNVINISSFLSCSPRETAYMAYGVTKAGLEHFTRGAALELAPSGIRVNSVHPGYIRTNLADYNDDTLWNNAKEKSALKKLGKPEEIADLVIFLASEKARSITGSTYLCDNGSLLLS